MKRNSLDDWWRTREVRDHHREALETIRQERERPQDTNWRRQSCPQLNSAAGSGQHTVVRSMGKVRRAIGFTNR
jgi:hypothetical protein